MSDPRIKILTDIMTRARSERAKRMITVGDMRRKEGRYTMQEEAAEMLASLDARTPALDKPTLERAAEVASKVSVDATDREMILRGDRIGANLQRSLLKVYDALATLSQPDKEGGKAR